MGILPKPQPKTNSPLKFSNLKSPKFATGLLAFGSLLMLLSLRQFAGPYLKERRLIQHEVEVLTMLGEFDQPKDER